MLYLYYYPAQLLAALNDVITHFAMQALDLFDDPNWGEVPYRTGIYGPRQYTRDVLQSALEQMTIRSRNALTQGIRHSRLVPDPTETCATQPSSRSSITVQWNFLFERLWSAPCAMPRKLV